MSVVTGTSLTSLRVVAASIDGSLVYRVDKPLRSAGNAMMGRFLDDHQRYDAIACGVPTTSKETSPGRDIEAMKKKVRAAMLGASSPGAGQMK